MPHRHKTVYTAHEITLYAHFTTATREENSPAELQAQPKMIILSTAHKAQTNAFCIFVRDIQSGQSMFITPIYDPSSGIRTTDSDRVDPTALTSRGDHCVA